MNMRDLFEHGIKVKINTFCCNAKYKKCKLFFSFLNQMIVFAQIDGQMAVAVHSLESATNRCVNCDVYGWKQVVDFFVP